MSDEPRKRSRFDQIEPEPARKSRFDRRSRSPVARSSHENGRSRSPIKNSASGQEEKIDPAAAAAAAAARINASLNAKKGIQHVDVPPIRSTQSPAAGNGNDSPKPANGGTLNEEIYQQDGDFIKDIEVNDLRNRYTLTKGSTQKMIKEETGADVTTRGNYYPDKSMATAANPPLYLHVTSTTKEGLEKAVARIHELMQQELPNLIDERRFRRREQPSEQQQPQQERDSFGRRKWPEERIPIDLEPIPGFNLRAQVVGAGGSYVKHIQQITRCRVQIKGRGSGFMEHDTGRESDEQMFLHVAGPEQEMVDQAKEQCMSLLETVRKNYEEFKDRPPQNRGGSGGYGGGGYNEERGGSGYHHRGDRQNSGSYGGGSSYGGSNSYSNAGGAGYSSGYNNSFNANGAYAGAQSPQAAQTTTDPAEQQKQYAAWVAYYAQHPDADPYAAYGGYAAVMAQYQQTAYQGFGTPGMGQSQSPVGANGGVPPPPPDDSNGVPPPPPPPPGAGNGSSGYHVVPPPPGL